MDSIYGAFPRKAFHHLCFMGVWGRDKIKLVAAQKAHPSPLLCSRPPKQPFVSGAQVRLPALFSLPSPRVLWNTACIIRFKQAKKDLGACNILF